jgi:hypothetical protein
MIKCQENTPRMHTLLRRILNTYDLRHVAPLDATNNIVCTVKRLMRVKLNTNKFEVILGELDGFRISAIG